MKFRALQTKSQEMTAAFELIASKLSAKNILTQAVLSALGAPAMTGSLLLGLQTFRVSWHLPIRPQTKHW